MLVGRSPDTLVARMLTGSGLPPLSQSGKVQLTMDRAIYKLIVIVAIGLAVAYLWVNYNMIGSEVRAFIANLWK